MQCVIFETGTAFLGVFPKLWSVHTEQLHSHWTDFHEIWYFWIFLKSVMKIQVSLKSDKNNVYFTWRPICIFYHILLISSYNENCFRKKFVEEIKTHILCSVTSVWKSCHWWESVKKYCGVGQATDNNMAHVHCMLDN